MFFSLIGRTKLQKLNSQCITVLTKIGKHKYMSWAPTKEAVVLPDLCHEGHEECLLVSRHNSALIGRVYNSIVFWRGHNI